jgi:hypothetical protein
MNSNCIVVCAAILMVVHTSLFAQEIFTPPEIPEIYVSTQTNETIIVDRLLDEAIWSSANIIDDFLQKDPDQGAPSSYPTEVKVISTPRGLYVGAICYQPKSTIVVRNLERDFEYFQNDLFGISIDGILDKRNALTFQVTPLGNMRDMQIIDGGGFNPDWNANWNAKTTVYEDRWIAEMFIPWNVIRYTDNSDQIGVILTRNIRSRNEFTSAPGVPRALTVYRMEYGGILNNLETPPPSTNIQVTPYILTDYRDFKNGAISESDLEPKLGGDIKWGVTSNSVLDLTFNTDFAQAEADQQVVNFNRFSVFFPERRQFFLENYDLFSMDVSTWVLPFFSRRIGLSNQGTPIPIDAGARLVTQNAKYSLGALAIRQREFNGTPASNFGVFRFSRNFSGQSRFGGLATFRNDQPLNNIASHNNFTFTLDGLHRFNQSFSVQAMVSASSDEITGDGLGGQLWFGFRNNLMYAGLLHYYNRSYNPGIGLEILDDNYIMTSPALNLDLRPKWLPSFIRSYNPGLYAYIFNDSETFDHLFSYMGIGFIELNFQDRSVFYITYEPNWQDLDFSFFPVGIEVAPGSYQYDRWFFKYSTNPAAQFSGSINAAIGSYFDGSLNTYTFSGRIAPIPQIALEASYELSEISNLGINDVDETTRLLRVGTSFALNPRILFSSLYQWNDVSDQHLWNARLSWEFRPLSFIYLVLNSSVADDPTSTSRINQQQYIAKVSYVHQF